MPGVLGPARRHRLPARFRTGTVRARLTGDNMHRNTVAAILATIALVTIAVADIAGWFAP